MFIFKVLLVCLGVRHLSLAHGACVDERGGGRLLLIGAALLQLSLLLRILLL